MLLLEDPVVKLSTEDACHQTRFAIRPNSQTSFIAPAKCHLTTTVIFAVDL